MYKDYAEACNMFKQVIKSKDQKEKNEMQNEESKMLSIKGLRNISKIKYM